MNRAFGTAIKFWAPSAMATLAMYVALSYLTWKVFNDWPEGPFRYNPPPPPDLPLKIPQRLLDTIPHAWPGLNAPR